MIRSHLSRLMGEKRVRVIDVARATGISRNFLAKLYHDQAVRIDLNDLAKLCAYFECPLSALLESIPEPMDASTAKGGRLSKRRRR